MRIKVITVLLLPIIYQLSTINPVAAAPGTTGGQFLKINPSARASAMGGAFGGLADDIFALYSNPAGLARLEKAEFATTYLRYFGDVNFGFIGYASQVRDVGVVGFSYTYLLADKIEKRGTDETLLGDFNVKDTSLSLSYARKDAVPSILEGLDLGGSIKLVNSEIDQTIAYTAAFDAAAMYSPVEKLHIGIALQNISPGIRFKEVTDQLPLDLKLGIAYRPSEELAIGADIDEYIIDNKFYAAIGTEYWAAKQLALRAGYRFGYDTASLGSMAGFSAGLGFRVWSVGMDYAFVPFGDLGDTHRITFTARF